ncbi:hypothetical protein NP233_g8047 [Leucocoprinus birnbaumii]|uniref:Myotubularin phosphatase domain-containing protein n=1 Tax=Leucocoprinus birnbaumii TaxID=56174 RepID=A0AAD5YU68_9AGAR|nr:hypothetical protein NP233_g8047 [Leucocoprinus birnbaumii]
MQAPPLIQLVLIATLAGIASLCPSLVFKPQKLISSSSVFSLSGVAAFAYLYNDSRQLLYASAASSAIISAFLSGLFASIAVYRLSPWHPLAQYPGPTLAKLSKWYMAYWIAKGNRHLKLQEWHRVYGPWIRIGPNEVSVDDPAAIRPIYSQMFRSLSYQGAPQDADALVTTVDKEEHALRLVAWTKAFSVERLKHYRASAQVRTAQLLDILAKQEKAVSLSHWISLWAIDVMGDMSFSGGFETLGAGKDEEGWMEVLHMGALFVGVLGQVPWMRDIIALAPAPGPIVSFQKFAGKKVEETGQKTGGNRSDILSIIQNDTEGGVELTRLQAHADASFIVLAGSDTVSEAMTALMRYIAADNEIQSRLRSELTGAFDGPLEDKDASTLLKLPYLDACVQEALRLVPPVAAGPPRWNENRPTQVLDHVIPARTTIAPPNYALFRDPRNFFNPNKFMPERWLGGITPHNTEAFVPFCFGPGVCIGKPVAIYNMKLLAASLTMAFDITFPENFDIAKFDNSYREHNLWVHDELLVKLKPLRWHSPYAKMDSIRVPKVRNLVEQVAITKGGVTSTGTVHLTAHHLIFDYEDKKLEETWVPYPLISLVQRLPQALNGQSPLSFSTRTFEAFTLLFLRDSDATDVFESVKELTVAVSVTQLYAFFYSPNPPLPTNNGWSLYSPREEFGRMGLGTRTKAWRFTDVNKDYTFCPTYPARMVVPTRISDTTLQYASKYRSKCRIPVLTYLHWANYGSITRSSQPMVGITQNRSIQDEKLIEAIFQTHVSPDSRAHNGPVYGATPTNLIIDARPTANAVANTAKGAGTENMDHYKDAKKAYLGIDNIHTMRESLAKVVEALREADAMLASINNDLASQVSGISVLDRSALRRSGWLRHIQAIMEGTLLITRNVHINSSHVLIHCSDGWDRTSQLSSLSQLCLDPFYRTIRGFEILIEKDWLSFGHKFLDRCGHLSSEKFFISPTENAGSGGGADAAQAFIASVQNRFASQHHLKETSPVFHQFLESVRQVQRQFPKRFEFNERFLRQIYYHLYSCQFGTFLFDCERDRRVGSGGPPPCERTVSVWDFLNSAAELEKYKNPDYDPSLDDPTNRSSGADMGVLLPNPRDLRFWNELYGRSDEEMNGRVISPVARLTEFVGPIEGAVDDPVLNRSKTPSNVPLPPSPKPSPGPLDASLSVGPVPARTASPSAIGRSLSIPSTPSQDNSSGAGYSLSPPPLGSMVPDWFSSSSQQSPQRSRPKPPEFFTNAGTGVRSMWGKLSSNASTAFSAVQEAYAGMAKDLGKSGGGSDEIPSSRTAELHGREMLSAWGEESAASSRSGVSQVTSSFSAISVSTNPWATERTDLGSSTSAWDENPWNNTPKATPQKLQVDPGDLSDSLPLDPTVATPLRRTTAPTARIERVPQPSTSPPPNTGASDPLGVGPL